VPATAPTFEVVSIKRSDPNATSGGIRIREDGQLTMTNQGLSSILGAAYPDAVEYVGLPDWMRRDRYDLVATPPAGAPRAVRPAMWRAMFAERLHLVAHAETREVPAFALVLARADGRLGPQLTPSTLDCAAQAAESRTREQRGGRPEPPSPATAAQRCGLSAGRGTMVSGSVAMSEFVLSIRGLTGRPTVVDKTGLTGRYALSLTFEMSRSPSPDAPARDPDGPASIFTALQEQLGLKLEPIQSSVQVLVIERIERPTEN
jgi:uncharacterized protein (TIGR03435 family)